MLAVQDRTTDIIAFEIVGVAEAAEKHRRISREKPGRARLQRAKAGSGRHIKWQPGSGRVADTARSTIGNNTERIAPGTGFETQRSDEVRFFNTAVIELVTCAEFDVAQGTTAGIENPVRCLPGKNCAAYCSVRAIHIRHPHLKHEAVGNTDTASHRCSVRVAFHLSHVDQADKQSGNDGMPNQPTNQPTRCGCSASSRTERTAPARNDPSGAAHVTGAMVQRPPAPERRCLCLRRMRTALGLALVTKIARP